MFAWLKSLVHEEITAEDYVGGMAFREMKTGRPFWNGMSAPDFSEVVKKCGTQTRVFKDTRHDN